MCMKNNKKHKKTVFVWIVLFVLIAVFLLFPRAQYVKDGGSARYCSFCKGLIYEIDNYHSFYDEGGNIYYQVGCVIYIFGHEVFNNVHVDYSHLAVEKNDAEFNELDKEIESILFPTE